ncbi:LysR family transcriptional regulator [Klebsiella aerogenes]|nr:LysR family transcriptional regulator [Klebsiella aerogenes]
MTAGNEPFSRRMAAAPYPAYGPCYCELKISILSPWLLKLPVLVASKSLRRSRKAGAARMDAG